MANIRFLIVLVILATAIDAKAQITESLYPDKKIPNSISTTAFVEKSRVYDGILIINGVTVPSLTRYMPANGKANGASIIIFPGGGYTDLAAGHEGSDVAKAFTEIGVTAFVVKYRLPSLKIMETPEVGPLQDGLRAIQVVRSRAKEWNLDPERIGIIGFSAGGHLASTVGTKYNQRILANPENVNLRANFMILAYPVISSDPTISHRGSFEILLGEKASEEKLREWSSEYNVTEETPPTFLFHASDDDVVKSENSIVFYQALIAHHVPAEMHIYQGGGHGYGLKNPTTTDQWIERVRNWMRANKFIQ